MDHIVYLDAHAKELENLITGNKSMILKASAGRKHSYDKVVEGDVLYFINNNVMGEVQAKGVVSSVFSSDKLSFEESFEMIINHQDKLQLPDEQFYKLAGKRYLVLIGLVDVAKLEPFHIDRSIFTNMDDCISVGNIEEASIDLNIEKASKEKAIQ